MNYNTPTRRLILEFLQQNCNEYVSVSDIEKWLNQQEKSASASTIYRYLDYLLEEKIVIRRMSAKKAVYQYVTNKDSEHLHMTCTECGVVKDLPDELVRQAEQLLGFKIECDQSILQGSCTDCN
ncbi:MAG: hypothetical protein ATN35_12975 [Epulopiscium sp. Nele67-Bin004]|nr:MAG: hypothetical protein ATN35_12975 [Epulopiscium sp. Nele67-Bin004]